jgi:hypothetical protein
LVVPDNLSVHVKLLNISGVFRSFSGIFGVVDDDQNYKGLGQEQSRRPTRDEELFWVVTNN